MKLVNRGNNKVELQQSISVLEIPDNDFATLLSVDTVKQEYTYKVRFYVDPKKAAQYKTFLVELQISTNPLNSNPEINTIVNNTNKDMAKNILLRNQRLRDLFRAQEQNIIKKIKVDITSAISNDITTTLSNARLTDDLVIRKRNIIRSIPIQELNERNMLMPVLDTNLNSVNANKDNRSDNSLLRRDATNLIYSRRIDPAAFTGRKTDAFFSAKRTSQGVAVSKNFLQFQNKNNFFEETRLIRSLLATNQTTNQSQLPNNTSMNVSIQETSSQVEVEKTFTIPFNRNLEPDFYINYRLANTKGLFVQNVTKIVEHSKNIEKIQIPVLPPSITFLKHTYNGGTLLELKQNDVNSTKIRVYRKDFKKTQPNTDAEFIFVSEVEAKSTNSLPVIVSDPYISSNPVLYRAIAVNEAGIVGAEFNSFVVETTGQTITKRDRRFKKPYFVSLNYSVQTSGINIQIRDIPVEVIAIELLKRNKTNFEKEYVRVEDILYLQDVTNSAVVVTDIEVQQNKIYEYIVKLYFKTGSTQVAANNLLVEYAPVTNNIINIVTDNPVIGTVGNEIDVKFNIMKNIINTENNNIKLFLESQGFTDEFQNEITANREKLGNLFAIEVQRINITTSEIEHFGIIDSSEFSDITYGQPKGVKTLQPGYDYKYVLTAYARDPETLFSTANRTVDVNQNISYVLYPQKWKHPVTLNEGNLVTDNSLKRNHGYSTFTFGKITDIVEVNVSLNEMLPSLLDSKATQIGKNRIMVEWKVQGNVLKIDHFIIVLESIGIKTIVGKSHNISNSNYFQFVDLLTNGESGELTYSIIPVYYDFSRGSDIKTNQIII
jgi:hypothetical protein